MNDREKMLAHLQLALETRDHMIAVRFVMDYGEKLTALLTEPTLEEVLVELDGLKHDYDRCYERETALLNEHEALK